MSPRLLRANLLVTDVGFLMYWLASALSLFPPDWLYKDHDNPILHAWNWSFAPVDITASLLGLTSLWMRRQSRVSWDSVALLSLALTFCAGLMAVSFWTIRRDFDVGWWLPNLYLIVWPIIAVPGILRSRS